MLHISPRVPGQSFAELPFEEEILKFLWFLGHSAQIKTLTDVNVEHKNQKKSNETYYPRFTKVIIHHFMTKKPSIPRRNKVNWLYIRDDILFSTIKVVSRHQNTQQYGAILPIELTTEDIRNTKAYKEYYACATREAAPKPKASAKKKRGGSDSSTTPPTVVVSPRPITTVATASRLTAAAKGKQPARATSEKDNDDDDDDDKEEISKTDKQEATESGEGDDEETESDGESEEEETREEEEESFDPILRTLEDDEDDGNGEEDQGLRISEEQRIQEEEEADEVYRDVDINQGRGLQVSQDIEDSHVTLTPVHPDGVESIFTTASSPIAPLPTPTPVMTPSTIATITTSSDAPIPPTIIPSAILQNLPTFDSVFRFEERVKSLEVNFSEFMQTNQFAEAVSKIPGIVHQYMTKQMTKAIQEAVQIHTDRLQDSFQRENDEFLRTIDENMKKIIKGQVKSQVKEQVSQLKKILIEKMEGNKSIQRFDEQRNLYKALVDAYEADKTIIESYGDTAILKRRRGDDDDQERPSAGSDRGSKRRREGGEHESASTPSEPATRSASRSTTGTQSRQMSASESAFVEEPMQTTCQMDEPHIRCLK
uniref:Uncharacterized protein n=1 Tax=Tanacetum cinerariifolium TaxID=118510 RepID=A0A699K8V1_TANCI|nr:hypothetical protein [Tanacetum cinerariifolium]